MSKNCIIFAGGEPVSRKMIYSYLPKEPYVICADKGWELADKNDIKPDLVIGDFDSSLKPENEPTKVYPVEKDDTDLMLAIKEGIALGYNDFTIFGATGGRFDHMIGNIQSLAYLLEHNCVGRIISDSERIQLLSPGKYNIYPIKDFSLSLAAYSEIVGGLSIKGAKYEVDDCVLTNNFPLGISNKITADHAEIEFNKGILLVIQSDLCTKF